MQKIKEFNPNLTILICAYSFSLSFCDRILKVDNGKVYDLNPVDLEGINISQN